MSYQNNVYIVFEGMPATFTDLDVAEEWAADKCEEDHKDRTITIIPKSTLEEKTLVCRYHGVMLHTLQEAKIQHE